MGEVREAGHLYAFIELAKHYEHKQRDVKSALKWTKSALKHVEKADMPAYMRKYWVDEIEHRMERLKRKAGYIIGINLNWPEEEMNITVSQAQGKVPVTVIKLDGNWMGRPIRT